MREQPTSHAAIPPPDGRSRSRARITRSGDFDAVYQRGRSAAGRHLVLYAFTRPDATAGAAPRLGLSVSRKVGGAVERNRVKRVLRERFAELAPSLPPGTDFVAIARPGLAAYLEERGSAAVGERLAELVGRLAPRSEGPS
jgi:ribonuclease P protein component